MLLFAAGGSEEAGPPLLSARRCWSRTLSNEVQDDLRQLFALVLLQKVPSIRMLGEKKKNSNFM